MVDVLSRSEERSRARDAAGAETVPPAAHYSAFISYNHRDKKWAAWIHRALETYRLPKTLVGRDTLLGTASAKLPPVFRDREELAASSNLADSVTRALEQAASLIVICSPAGAASRWVNEEIRTFRRLGRGNRIQCVVVGGEPNAARRPDLDPALECLPEALFEDGGSEPLAVDLRQGGDGKQVARLKLIAGILGVGFDELRQREAARRQRRLAALASAALFGLVITSGLAIFALLSRAEAIKQRDIARQKTMTAERTVDFVKSLFEVADPSQAKGETISAREIVDAGARRLATELKEEPAVKAELSTTLGEVYLGLGLFRQADGIIRRSLDLRQPDPTARARQYAALASSQVHQGDYAAAIRSYREGLALARLSKEPSRELIATILVGAGEAKSAIDQFDHAEKLISLALRIDLQRYGNSHPVIARDLEALGLSAFYAGEMTKARPLFDRALDIRRRTQGENHPKVAENLNTLGSIAYLQRDSAGAERYYRDVLRRDEVILGPEHPDLAFTLNNIGRMVIERRGFSEALLLLRRSAAISLRERGETQDDLAFVLANLAMAERGVGNVSEAEGLFGRALKAARLHRHRNLAPILADLADLRCASGRAGEALPLLDEARPLMASTYPDDPWRVAWVDNVRGGCLAALGQRREGLALLSSSAPALKARWKAGSLYAWMADARLRTARAGA